MASSELRHDGQAEQDWLSKVSLLAQLRDGLAGERHRATLRARDAAEATTHEENRAEGDKDMRATEASYVARGQAARVAEIERALAQLGAMEIVDIAAAGHRACASAIVVVEQTAPRPGRTTYLLVTAAGGVRLRAGDAEIVTLTTTSPLGAALVGLGVGEEAEIPTPQGVREYRVVEVR
jgi:transcription elongation GreA/GreB family factor